MRTIEFIENEVMKWLILFGEEVVTRAQLEAHNVQWQEIPIGLYAGVSIFKLRSKVERDQFMNMIRRQNRIYKP